MISNKILSFLKDYLIKYRVVIIYSILLSIACYGYELFNFTLSLDEEGFSFSKATNRTDWIADGRWGTYFINCLFMPFSLIPYFPTLIAVLCIAMANIIFINSEEHDFFSKLIFSTIFISFPIHSYYLTFNTFSIAIGIGLVSSVLGFVITKEIMKKQNIKYIRLLIPIGLLVISFSIYQAIMVIYVILVLTHILSILIDDDTISHKEIFRKILMFAGIFIFSLILYKLSDNLIKIFYSNDPIIKSRKYLEGYIGWTKKPPLVVFSTLLKSIFNYVSGNRFYGGTIMKSVILFASVLSVIIFLKVKKNLSKIMAITSLILLILSPFAVMIIVGGDLPPRTMFSLAFMVASLWWLCFRNLKLWIKDLVILATIFFMINNIYCTTRLFYSTYVNWQADRDMAIRIVERIYTTDNQLNRKSIPIAFIGAYKHPSNQLFLTTNWEILGCSFFQYNKNDHYRICGFMQTLGINEFKMIDDTKNHEISKKSVNMPSWPQNGSVAHFGDTIVIKLSD